MGEARRPGTAPALPSVAVPALGGPAPGGRAPTGPDIWPDLPLTGSRSRVGSGRIPRETDGSWVLVKPVVPELPSCCLISLSYQRKEERGPRVTAHFALDRWVALPTVRPRGGCPALFPGTE